MSRRGRVTEGGGLEGEGVRRDRSRREKVCVMRGVITRKGVDSVYGHWASLYILHDNCVAYTI
jgi:hypothetical protein